MRRVNELLKREIAILVERIDLQTPDSVVSINAVDTSPDLRHAKVGVSVLGGGDEERAAILKILRKSRGDMQASLAKNVRLKYTPVLEFSIDTSIESGDRVLAILAELEGDAPLEDEDIPIL